MRTAIVRKYVKGMLVSTQQLVRYKGKYIPPDEVPKRIRCKTKLGFFKEAIAKMTDTKRGETLNMLRSVIWRSG